MQLALGQGGSIIILLYIGKTSATYLTGMIDKQEVKDEKRSKRYDELHVYTLEHINASTNEIKALRLDISKVDCLNKKKRKNEAAA